MRAIIGLGNPGSKYEKTKHNVGFSVIDEIAKEHNVTMKKHTFEAEVGDFFYQGNKILLIKPLTFMNESGRAVGPLMTYFNITPEDILVVCDDLDLAVGKLRLRQKGSAGGHNGLKSIIAHLNTQEFPRLKVGIGRPKGKMSVVNHVLSRFDEEDQPLIMHAYDKGKEVALYFGEGHTFQDTTNFLAKE